MVSGYAEFMRKLTVAMVVMAALALILMPGTAFAQKDPFRPLVRPEGAPAAPAAPGPPAPAAPAQPGPALPVTGAEVAPYLVMALALIAFGGALLGIDKYRSYA